jgi:flagellar FliJ protein
MTQAFPMQQLLDLAALRTDEATRELGRRIAAEQDANQRLQLLETYRGEYAQRFSAAQQRGLSPAEWTNYLDFLARLDDAIAQQTKAVKASELRRTEGQSNWQTQNNQLKAFDTLAERHQRRERQSADRRDQKVADELVARRHSQRRFP